LDRCGPKRRIAGAGVETIPAGASAVRRSALSYANGVVAFSPGVGPSAGLPSVTAQITPNTESVAAKAEFARAVGLKYPIGMLNGIHIVDFGNHRNTRLTFGPMTALVGKNGSGKTTVMRAIGEVARIASHGPIFLNESFLRRGGKQEILTASWPDSISASCDKGFRIADTTQSFFRRRAVGETAAWIPDPKIDVELKPFQPSLRSSLLPGEIGVWDGPILFRIRYFKTSARSLQLPAIADDEEPIINDDGSNLAWSLAYLMTAEPDRFARIIEALREVVPIVNRVRSRPVKLTRLEKRTVTINKQERSYDEEREVMGQELIFDMMSGTGLPASAVSEGTLVVLAILTLVHGSDGVDLIMLDDVELGLHPKAQRDLMRQLRRLQEKRPKLQIIVSTHSPYVIDEFKPEEVWLFSTDSDGCAVSKRLSEHPDAKRGLEVLTTGEFWSAEGESWVLGEEPSARVAEGPGK